jgi:hypothetical protein
MEVDDVNRRILGDIGLKIVTDPDSASLGGGAIVDDVLAWKAVGGSPPLVVLAMRGKLV